MNGKRNRTGLIFRKEFGEIFRDRRTLFSVVVSPLLITPALFAVMGLVIRGQVEKSRTETITAGIAGVANAPDLVEELKKTPNLNLESVDEDKAAEAVRTGRIRAVAVLPPDTQEKIDRSSPVTVKLVVDAGRDVSQNAGERLKKAFESAGKKLVDRRLKAAGLSGETIRPFKVEEAPIERGGSRGTFMLAMFLPYILALSSFAGGMYAANDQVAGEKERGTLETLLVSPASRREIVIGKFLAVAGVCLVSSLLSVVGLIIPFYSGIKAFEWLTQGGAVLSGPAIAAIVLVQIPLAVLFAGILMAVSTFARNQKEAQTYQGPLLMAVLLPAMMSTMIGTDAGRALALVPILNATMVLKQALSNSIDPLFLGIAVASSVVYAGLALLFATRLFQKESVLIKS